jgi:hypothetical protein
MKNPLNLTVNLTASFLLAYVSMTAGSLAQAPSGTFEYNFTTNDGAGLWNFSGSYQALYYFDTNCMLRLTHYGRGNLEGKYREVPYGNRVAGTARGSSQNIKLRLNSVTWPVGALVRGDRLTLSFDSVARTLKGTDRVVSAVYTYGGGGWFSSPHVVSGFGLSSRQQVVLAVPQTTDGNWHLTLHVTPTGNKLSGTGSIEFANGMVYHFQLIGSYAPQRNTSKVLLKGINESKGAFLVLSIATPELGIQRLSGRVGGQSVKLQ